MEDNALQELPGGWQVAFRFWSALCQLDDDWCQVRVWWTMPICTRAAGTPNSGSELLTAEPTSTTIVNVILFHGSNFLVQDHPVFALCGRGLRKLSTGTQRFVPIFRRKTSNLSFVLGEQLSVQPWTPWAADASRSSSWTPGLQSTVCFWKWVREEF